MLAAVCPCSDRGYAHSVEELLHRLPLALKDAVTVHFHGGKNNAELRAAHKLWFGKVSALQPLAPPRSGTPPPADVAIMTPRCEIAPVSVALYLLSSVPFALLISVELLPQVRKPNLYPGSPHDQLALRLEKAGKVTILDSQMVWEIGNVPGCCPAEIFAARLRTRAPLAGFERPGPVNPANDPQTAPNPDEDVEGALPRTLEAWIKAQKEDPDFDDCLVEIEDKAQRQELWIYAPAQQCPTIIVPRTCRELFVRDAHSRMFHLNHAKVYALLHRSYFLVTMKKDVRKFLEDCPICELNKARQNTAHGLFSAQPICAPVRDGAWIFRDKARLLQERPRRLP
jgi:hypothetical protein